MNENSKTILTVNGGSSSLKFGIYTSDHSPSIVMSGKIERIGSKDSMVTTTDPLNQKPAAKTIEAHSMQQAVLSLITLLEEKKGFDTLAAVGQRIVHGMQITEPQLITDSLIGQLQEISSYDPDHLPGEIELIKAFKTKLPDIPQVACFDTRFHTGMPRLAALLPIPRKYADQGIKKYGFHGLSYSYIMEQLLQRQIPAATRGRIIIAHLGSGSSMTAVLDGKPVDTSMGFTPTGGLMMGTRTGDMDPGLAAFIMKKESMNAEDFNQFVNHQCGLFGISETSSDMLDLLKRESTDLRASEAIQLFCYQAKKWIGAFTSVLQGLDTLVFTGGIGENASLVRSRICQGLEFLGIEIDEKKNRENAENISSANRRVAVYVIPTNEEFMIAKLTHEVLLKK